MQPFSFGSFTAVRPFRRERLRERGRLVPRRNGDLCHGLRAGIDDGYRPRWPLLFGFGAVASGAAAASDGAEPGTEGEGTPIKVCAVAGVRPTRAVQVSPAIREERIV